MVHLPEWDCRKCNAGQQKIRGCGVQGMTATLMGTERVTTCPRYAFKAHSQTMSRILRVHRYMEGGHLPHPGGIMDQGAQAMEALEYFSAGLSRAKADEAKKRTPGNGAK